MDGLGRQRAIPHVLLDESILDGVQDRRAQGSGCVVAVAAAFLAVDTNAAVSSWMVDRLEEGGEVTSLPHSYEMAVVRCESSCRSCPSRSSSPSSTMMAAAAAVMVSSC